MYHSNLQGEVCLLDISCLFGRIVSITQFNKGKASQLFLRASRGETLLVMKNNSPVAVVISPEEYEILRKIPRLCGKTSVNGNDMGIRHHAACNGDNCALLPTLCPGELLVLEEEPENKFDPMAIRVVTQQNEHLGYIPRCYKLKRIADNHGITILLVHHLRKQGDRDPVNRLSGTTGISGAVDAVFVLDSYSKNHVLWCVLQKHAP